RKDGRGRRTATVRLTRSMGGVLIPNCPACSCVRARRSSNQSLTCATTRSSLRNARQAQAFHVALAVLVAFEWIPAAEVLDREGRLQAQQFLHVRPCLVEPPQMAERGNERLIACDEIGHRFGAAPPDDNGTLIVSLERIRDGVEALEERRIGVERRKL